MGWQRGMPSKPRPAAGSNPFAPQPAAPIFGPAPPPMTISYSSERALTPAQFIDLLQRSSLAERRPIDDADCVASMLAHANLLCTAWDDERLIGVARSVTDFSYCCYLSDLAVDAAHQRRGIGRGLLRLTQSKLGPRCTIILLAAPKAETYYPRLGFTRHESAWLIRRSSAIA